MERWGTFTHALYDDKLENLLISAFMGRVKIGKMPVLTLLLRVETGDQAEKKEF